MPILKYYFSFPLIKYTFKDYILLKFYVNKCLPAYMYYVPYVCAWFLRRSEVETGQPGLQLQMGTNHHVSTRNWTPILCKRNSVLNHWAISLAPWTLFLSLWLNFYGNDHLSYSVIRCSTVNTCKESRTGPATCKLCVCLICLKIFIMITNAIYRASSPGTQTSVISSHFLCPPP